MSIYLSSTSVLETCNGSSEQLQIDLQSLSSPSKTLQIFIPNLQAFQKKILKISTRAQSQNYLHSSRTNPNFKRLITPSVSIDACNGSHWFVSVQPTPSISVMSILKHRPIVNADACVNADARCGQDFTFCALIFFGVTVVLSFNKIKCIAKYCNLSRHSLTFLFIRNTFMVKNSFIVLIVLWLKFKLPFHFYSTAWSL